jgi:hypothetical protein
MFTSPNLSNTLKTIIVFLPFLLYLLVFLISPDIIYYADGLQHFLISNGITDKKELLLDHWGKPLFSLLIFPFSFLGLKGLVVFNLLLTGLIILLLQKIAAKLDLPWWTTFFAAALMLSIPEYFLVTFAGLTEILFAALVSLVLYLILSERYNLAALVAGFTLFSRPESEIFLPLLVVFLITQKKFKVLLWLPAAFILYAIIGWFMLEDFWWYFNKKPYNPEGSAYGSGEVFHFFKNFPTAIGISLTALLILGMVISLIDLRKPFSKRTLFWWLLVIAPSVAVLTVHSYLWWKGIYGSAGLMRVLVTTTPLYALIAIRSFSVLKTRITTVAAVLISAGASSLQLHDTLKKYEVPIKMDSKTAFLRQVGAELKPLISNEDTLYAIEPFTLYWAGRNGMADTNIVWLSKAQSKGKLKPPGKKTAFIWDDKFGPVEGRIPLHLLLNEKNLQLKKAWAEEPDLLNFRYLSEIYYFEAGDNPGPFIEYSVSKSIIHKKSFDGDGIIIPDEKSVFAIFDVAIDTMRINKAVVNISFSIAKENSVSAKEFKVIVKTFNDNSTTYYGKWPARKFVEKEKNSESSNVSFLLPPFKTLPPETILRVELLLLNDEPIELRDFTIQLFEVPD